MYLIYYFFQILENDKRLNTGNDIKDKERIALDDQRYSPPETKKQCC